MISPIHTTSTPDRALAIISHELRQPLNIIRLHAAVLRLLPESTAPMRIRRIAQAIERAIDSQARIIADLLELSRVRTGKLVLQRRDVDFGALVVDLVTTLGASWAAGRVALEVMQSHPLICHADSVRLEQIVGNLLNNAIKATAAAGQIVVRISAEDGFARLSVVDNGCGIAPEFLPHAFGLFRQADGKEGRQDGLGVGLALVHALTMAHGGFVKAKSAGIDCGAEFSVWLPLSSAPSLPSSCFGSPSQKGRAAHGMEAGLVAIDSRHETSTAGAIRLGI